MINEWRYHFLGGPLNGQTFATGKQEIHDVEGLVDFPPTNEAWAKYRDAALAVKPGDPLPEVPPRVEYRIAASEARTVTGLDGDQTTGATTVADMYMVPTTVTPDQELLFLCRLAKFHIDKVNDAKASS